MMQCMHDWQPTGRTYRAPCRLWWPEGLMGSAEFKVYKCSVCGAETKFEIPNTRRQARVEGEAPREEA